MINGYFALLNHYIRLKKDKKKLYLTKSLLENYCCNVILKVEPFPISLDKIVILPL